MKYQIKYYFPSVHSFCSVVHYGATLRILNIRVQPKHSNKRTLTYTHLLSEGERHKYDIYGDKQPKTHTHS